MSPTVSVIVPTYRESAAIDACLESITAQKGAEIVQILVVDGLSDDDTCTRARRHRGVTVVENPARIQAAALNIGLAAATGEVTVRVDGHCRLAPDYVANAVQALERTNAAMVGGAMSPVAHGARPSGIAAAMRSRFGIGPARFHVGGSGGWVDTVYLGAYRTELAREVGGYDEAMVANEDAEFAHRLGARGGIWFDPSIRSHYTPRSSLPALARQFHRYGRFRARTVLRHPSSLRPRQLAPVALVLGLVLGPRRRWVLGAYGVVVAVATALDGTGGPAERASYAAALPTMHVCWGAGFVRGVAAELAGRVRGRG